MTHLLADQQTALPRGQAGRGPRTHSSASILAKEREYFRSEKRPEPSGRMRSTLDPTWGHQLNQCIIYILILFKATVKLLPTHILNNFHYRLTGIIARQTAVAL